MEELLKDHTEDELRTLLVKVMEYGQDIRFDTEVVDNLLDELDSVRFICITHGTISIEDVLLKVPVHGYAVYKVTGLGRMSTIEVEPEENELAEDDDGEFFVCRTCNSQVQVTPEYYDVQIV